MKPLAAAILVCVSTAALAVPEGWQPVDQGVADLDRLSTSQRQMQIGLRYDGEQTSLFRPPGSPPIQPYSPTLAAAARNQNEYYYRVGPGFIARVTRLDYLVRVGRESSAYNIKPRQDGEFLELVTAGTTWELRPLHQLAPQAPPPTPAPDYRLDLRIQPQRIDTRAK
jgi:hypothetical protein